MSTVPPKVLSIGDADTSDDDYKVDLEIQDPVSLALAQQAKIRFKDGVLQASLAGADWVEITQGSGMPSDWVLASDLGILPTNTHAQNVAAWNTAMRAGTTPQRWLFEGGTYLFDSVLEVTRQIAIEGVAGDGTTGGTWFRFATGSNGGVWFRGYDNVYGRSTASSMRHIHLDGDGTHEGILCNSRVTLTDIFVQSFDIGVSIYGNVGANTEASGCHLERVFASQNTSWGIKTDGPDGNTANIINCTASDNGVGGFWDSSFLGCYWFGNHAEANGTYSYYNDDAAARPVFIGNYSEAGQQCTINFPAVSINGIHGDGDSGFYGNGIQFTDDEVLGRQLKFPFLTGGRSGFIGFGAGLKDPTPSGWSQFNSPSAGGDVFYSTWNNGYGAFSNTKQHDVWGSGSGSPAFEITSSASDGSTSSYRADYPRLVLPIGAYVGANRHYFWTYYEEFGTPEAGAYNQLGYKTLVTGDRFYSYRTNAAQHGLSSMRQDKYEGYVCTRSGTLGTYPDGRTATTDGTLTFILSGSNTTLAVGHLITVGGSGPVRITAINGTSVTVATITGGGSLPAASSGNAIAFYAPVLSAFGRITGQGTDATGTPGAATSQAVSGRVAIAAGASSVVVTNARVTSSSNILATLQTTDGTLTFIKSVVPGSGSFTITGNANATGNVNVGWFIVE